MIREVAELGFAIATNVVDAPTRQNLIAELGPVASAGRRGLLVLDIAACCTSNTRCLTCPVNSSGTKQLDFDIMVCEHLAELEHALIAAHIPITFRGQLWTSNCREWVY